jgi:NTP pyrophosphatase (non-canonical NTP hydrolase)
MADALRTITVHVDPLFSGIYVIQRAFQARLHEGQFPASMSEVDRMEYLRTQSLALTDELHEALAETGWKPWATSNHINRDAYAGELADVFIFFMNLMLVADITPSELLALVKEKQTKNAKRQDDGYDGVTTKCPGCKRAYDDDAVKCFPGSNPGYAWCEAVYDWVAK